MSYMYSISYIYVLYGMRINEILLNWSLSQDCWKIMAIVIKAVYYLDSYIKSEFESWTIYWGHINFIVYCYEDKNIQKCDKNENTTFMCTKDWMSKQSFLVSVWARELGRATTLKQAFRPTLKMLEKPR